MKIGPGPELELGGALVVDRRAGHVGGHQVGRELDPAEAEARRLRERARDQRLREAGKVLDQHVAVGEQAEQDELERLALADDRALDLVEERLGRARRPRAMSSQRFERASTAAAIRSERERRPRRASRGRGCVGPGELPEPRGRAAPRRRCRAASRSTPRRRRARGGDVPDRRAEPEVRVEGGLRRQRDLALELDELARPRLSRRARRPAVEPRRRLARQAAERPADHGQERQPADGEQVDVDRERRSRRGEGRSRARARALASTASRTNVERRIARVCLQVVAEGLEG